MSKGDKMQSLLRALMTADYDMSEKAINEANLILDSYMERGLLRTCIYTATKDYLKELTDEAKRKGTYYEN